MTLKTITQRFQQDYNLSLKSSAELEFYLEGNCHAEHSEASHAAGDPSPSAQDDSNCLAMLLALCGKHKLPISKLEHEDGDRQYELDLPLRGNALQTAADILLGKELIAQAAEASGLTAIFAPKPYPEQPGCGLHIHISLHTPDGTNVLQKPDKKADAESEAMLHAVAGLLEVIPEAMVYFAPHEDSYMRYSSLDQHAPRYICWGGNNRTAAIRIPASTLSPENRHIELRVPGMDAEPQAALAAMLAGIHHGLKHKLTPPEKLYGNAFDKQYGIRALPHSLEEARAMHKKGAILKNYLSS